MKFEEFSIILNTLLTREKDRSEFIGKLPSSIKSAVFDNEYVDLLQKDYDMLIQSLFSVTIASDIYYFLYDWSSGCEIESLGQTYIINNQEDIPNYFKEEYIWE